MPNIVNKMVVREITSEFGDAEGMVIVSMAGLTVTESEALRGSIAERGARFRLVRNSLARIALKENGIEIPDDVFNGNVAIAYGDAEQAIGAAKALTAPELKKSGKVAIRAGMLAGSVLTASDAAALADVPDRDTLNAQLLGVISGPARSLVSLLAAPGGALARVVQARVDEGGGAE